MLFRNIIAILSLLAPSAQALQFDKVDGSPLGPSSGSVVTSVLEVDESVEICDLDLMVDIR